jgi:hypothetical protein
MSNNEIFIFIYFLNKLISNDEIEKENKQKKKKMSTRANLSNLWSGSLN